MKKRSMLAAALPLLLIAGAVVTGSGTGPGWALEGTWTDACCCKVSCPCFFGSPPTEGFCQGASLVEIAKGHHGEVSLDGVSAIVAYHIGDWSKIVVADGASPEQVAAMGALLPEALPFLKMGGPPSVETAPLVVAREGDAVSYSSARTRVALKMVRGANGKPIVIRNLPVPGKPFPESGDHTQYESDRLEHRSDDGEFEWSGRNGFTTNLNLSGSNAGG